MVYISLCSVSCVAVPFQKKKTYVTDGFCVVLFSLLVRAVADRWVHEKSICISATPIDRQVKRGKDDDDDNN